MDSLCSVCTHAQSLQSCLIFCDSTDCSLPGSFAHGTLQARILEMIARPSSKGSSPPRTEPAFLVCPGLSSGFFTTSATWEALSVLHTGSYNYLFYI